MKSSAIESDFQGAVDFQRSDQADDNAPTRRTQAPNTSARTSMPYR